MIVRTEIKVGKRLYKFETFDSILELKKANETRPVNYEWRLYKLTNEDVKSMAKWYGIDSIESAYRLLENGWQDGTDKCSKEINRLAKCGMQTKTKFENNVYGFTPIVPLAIQNIPTSMLNAVKREVKSKVITILYDNCALGNVSANELMTAGKNVISTVIELERKGYRVELKIGRFNYDKGRNEVMSCNVILKKASQPLNLKKMMYPVAHPSWFRIVTFDWQDKSPITEHHVMNRGKSYYGAVEQGYIKDENEVCQTLGKTDNYIGFMDAIKGTDYLVSKIIKK